LCFSRTNIPAGVPKSQREGIPIIAPADGTIESVKLYKDYPNGAGNRVHLRDKQGTLHSFFHMADNTIQVKVGQKVQQGDTIGGMGTTGKSTGVHLHYEMHDKAGNLLNPDEANPGLKKDVQ